MMRTGGAFTSPGKAAKQGGKEYKRASTYIMRLLSVWNVVNYP